MPRQKLWSPREHKLLLRAWDEIPPLVGEGERAHCERIHARFAELCGGATERTESAVQRQRAVMVYNHDFIADFERARTPSGQSWFDLSPRGQEEIFDASTGEKHQYMDMNVVMYAKISRVLKQPPVHAASPSESLPGQQPPPRKAVKRKSETAPSTEPARPAGMDWSHQEVLNLVRAWRDAVKVRSSHVPAKLNARVYERFSILCGGSTPRSLPAVSTRRRDLMVSHDFIANYNTAQRRNKQACWFSLSKLDKLAVLRSTERSRHISDIPQDVFVRVGEVLEGVHEADDCVSSESEHSDESDESVKTDSTVEKRTTPSAGATATTKSAPDVATVARRRAGGKFVSKNSLQAARMRPQPRDNSMEQLLGIADAINKHMRSLTKKVIELQQESGASERGLAASCRDRQLSGQLQGSPERQEDNLSHEAVTRFQNQGGSTAWMG